MNERESPVLEETVVMNADAMVEVLHRMAQEIIVDNPDIDAVALLGILKRGRPLADRLAKLIHGMTGKMPRVGSLATTLYRDDLRSGVAKVKPALGNTYFDFRIDNITVVLVDDVLAAGRTIRAAMDELMDYGRPQRIQLACLIDRGGRQLPIQPDYLGWSVSVGPQDHVSVRLAETDGQDVVLLEKKSAAPREEEKS
jgi:pyrimidine operon attenuation protein/uracil phosphoribosyltransferase